MRKRRSARERLEDIVSWGERTALHVDGVDRYAFDQDLKTQDAVMKCIEVIGEAAGQLARTLPEHGQRFPKLDLHLAYAARNRLSHGYFAVETELLWVMATESVPLLVSEARQALAGVNDDE